MLMQTIIVTAFSIIILSGDANLATSLIVEKILKCGTISIRDQYCLCEKLHIPSKKLQEIQLKASQRTNRTRAILTMVIDFWLKEINGSCLYTLAEVFDSMNIENRSSENKLGDLIREILLDFPILESDVEYIVDNLNSIPCNELITELKDICGFRKSPEDNSRNLEEQELTQSSSDTELKKFLNKWIENGHATWKVLFKALKKIIKEKAGKVVKSMMCTYCIENPYNFTTETM